MQEKSYYQQLSENLQEEVNELKNLLLEYGIGAIVDGSADYPATYDPTNPNKGGIAGFGVGAAANPTMIVANPTVVAQNLALGDAMDSVVGDPYTKTNLPSFNPLAPNIGYGMGLGYDQQTFSNTINFVQQFGSPILDDSQLDNPDESKYINWKRMNDAVHNFHSQRIKTALADGGIFQGTATDGYSQALPDEYNRFLYMPKNVKKVVDDTTNAILGKSFTGKNVSAKISKINEPTKKRFETLWSKTKK